KFSGDGAHIRCAPDGCQRPGGDNGYRSWPGNRCRRSSVRVRSVQPDGRKEHTTTPRVRVGTQRRPPLEELVSEAELAWKHGDAVAGKAAAREARDSGREWYICVATVTADLRFVHLYTDLWTPGCG